MKSKALKAIVSIIGLLLVLCVCANSLAAGGLFFGLRMGSSIGRQLNESKRLEALRSRSINRSSQCLVQQILPTFQWQPKRVAAPVNEHVKSIQLYVRTWADAALRALKETRLLSVPAASSWQAWEISGIDSCQCSIRMCLRIDPNTIAGDQILAIFGDVRFPSVAKMPSHKLWNSSAADINRRRWEPPSH